MAATYEPNPAAATDRDRVRFLIGDTDTSDAQIEDEEIEWLLTEEENVYLAAARALSGLHARWSSLGKGVIEKQTSRLRIRRGFDENASAAIAARIAELRKRGASDTISSPKVFKVL